MKTGALVTPCFNKAAHVERSVRSMLAQTYSPMELIFSDQGSTDGSLEIVERLVQGYNGPNRVRVLKCPDTEFRGMAGFNRHLNWIHEQIDTDVVMICSADDLNHPDRAKLTMAAYEEFNPSYVNTGVEYFQPDGTSCGISAHPAESGWVDPIENIELLIGSSGSSSWARDLWDGLAPMTGVESTDFVMPFFATLSRGLYYVRDGLHAYFNHADLDNTGMGGVLLAARSEEEGKALGETNNYHFLSNWCAILRRLQALNIGLSPEMYEVVTNKVVSSANLWAMTRDALTMQRIQPLGMRV